MNSLRIAFGFQARSGKSTAARYLVENYGGVEKSFAGPLYEILHFAQDICHFPQEKDRQFLQYIGTDWARKKDGNVWVNCLVKDVQSQDPRENIFVSDMRFPNEFYTLRENGFKTVLLLRDTDGDETFGSGSQQHESETAMNVISLSEWDFVIHNKFSLNNFYSDIDEMVQIIQSEYSQERNENILSQKPVMGCGETSTEILDKV